MALPHINVPPIQTKYKILLGTGLLLLILFSYYDHAYKPHAEAIAELRDEIALLDDTLTVIKTVDYPGSTKENEILGKISRKIERIKEAIREREDTLPRKTDFSRILEQITQMAYDAGFTIKLIEPRDFTITDQYQKMSLTMEIEARYGQFVIFLEKLSVLSLVPERVAISVANRPALAVKLDLAILAQE